MSQKVEEAQDLRIAAAQLEPAVGKHSPLMIHVLRPLVARLNALGRYQEARPYVEQILDIRRKHADASLPSLPDAYLAYVENLRHTGDHIDAVTAASSLFQEIAEEGLTGTDYEARARLAVADSYEKSGDHARAVKSMQRALDVYTALGDSHRGQCMSVHHSLSALYARQGDMAKAVEHAENQLSLAEKMLGVTSNALIPMLRDLIDLYRRAGQNAKADALDDRRRALKTRMDA